MKARHAVAVAEMTDTVSERRDWERTHSDEEPAQEVTLKNKATIHEIMILTLFRFDLHTNTVPALSIRL